jgi:polar amino acid transport system substrate-binding protein
MRRPRRPLLLILLACAASAQAACSRPVRVVISPMGRNMMACTGGQASGLVPDFLKQVAARTGCRFHFTMVPRARATSCSPAAKRT